MKFTKRSESAHGGVDKYIKFKDGESKNLVLRGEVYEFKNKWVNGKGVVCADNDPEGKSRFKVNAILKEGEALVAKIWEFPLTVYRQLGAINEEYPLETTKIKVTRHGVGTDTEYNILPLKDVVPPAVAQVDLNILDTKPAAKSPTPQHTNEDIFPGSDDELPF